MKYFIILLSLLSISLSFPIIKQNLNFKIISSNVRVNTHSRFHHEHHWNQRKGPLIELLKRHTLDKPTLIGLQELKFKQLQDLLDGFNHGLSQDNPELWHYYGIGRDDGDKKGEFAPIFYQPSKWELLNSTTKWLSETPDVPSKFWDAACYRIATITTFKNRETGNTINMLNTHYDHVSEHARGKSSELIIDWIDTIPNDYKTFLSGDFNSVASDASYQTLVQQLKDSRQIAKQTLSSLKTYTGFEPKDVHSVIDFIWCQDGVEVENYNVIDTWTEQGFRASDHRPVIVEFNTF